MSDCATCGPTSVGRTRLRTASMKCNPASRLEGLSNEIPAPASTASDVDKSGSNESTWSRGMAFHFWPREEVPDLAWEKHGITETHYPFSRISASTKKSVQSSNGVPVIPRVRYRVPSAEVLPRFRCLAPPPIAC